MFGFLHFDKPAGWTSRDVVNRVQARVRPVKVGHAGTLDPLATGVLVVALGPATRLVDQVQRLEKTYVATFLLGRESDTEDITGQVQELVDAPVASEAALHAVLPQFLGTIQQVPPAFSALKVRGQRAYQLARRGQSLDLAPRPVQIHALRVLEYVYPRLSLEIVCGSGTYVRSLGRDLARALGTGAVMSALQRTAIGPFQLRDALSPAILDTEDWRQHVQGPLTALPHLPRWIVTPADERRLRQGQTIDAAAYEPRTPADPVTIGLVAGISLAGDGVASAERAAVSATGELVALVSPRGAGAWGPFLGFPERGEPA